jgi:hypothetical protein
VKATQPTKHRKRNWNAGLTKEQAEKARIIHTAYIEAYYDERARGAIGTPGSLWEIGPDGKATHSAPQRRH